MTTTRTHFAFRVAMLPPRPPKPPPPEATEAATAAPSRIANTPTRGCEASMAPASDHGDRPPAHWQLACNIIILMETMAHDVKRKGGRFETSQDFAR